MIALKPTCPAALATPKTVALEDGAADSGPAAGVQVAVEVAHAREFRLSSQRRRLAGSFWLLIPAPLAVSKNWSFVGRPQRRRRARRRSFYLSGNGNPTGLRSINSVA